MKKILLLPLFSFALIAFFSACQPTAVEPEQGWITYEVRDGLSYNEAWMIVVDALLTRGYQFETLSKDDGYLKTEFLHETIEAKGLELRTRVSVKFTYGRKTIRMKIDEDYIQGTKAAGADIQRIADLKAELRDRLL
jgi:hypothetical protein